MDESDQIFKDHDHANIISLFKDKYFFESLRMKQVFSDRADFWDETISLLENMIKIEKEKYEQRYHVHFEEARPLLTDLEKHITKPEFGTGNANQIFG